MVMKLFKRSSVQRARRLPPIVYHPAIPEPEDDPAWNQPMSDEEWHRRLQAWGLDDQESSTSQPA